MVSECGNHVNVVTCGETIPQKYAPLLRLPQPVPGLLRVAEIEVQGCATKHRVMPLKVECCDASTQCVFEHEAQDGSEQPQSQLSGAALFSARLGPLLVLKLIRPKVRIL